MRVVMENIEQGSGEEAWRRRLRWALAVTFLVSLLIFMSLGYSVLSGAAESRKASALNIASSHAQRVSHRLQEAMSPAYILASLVQQERGRLADFETSAAELLALFPMVSSVQIAPNGVIEKVFPLPGNEVVVGSDLLRSPDRRLDAHQAIARRQLALGGPYSLIQGGVGVVGRNPVFLPDQNGWSKFWGFTIVVVRIPQLLDAANLPELARDGYRFELCKVMEEGKECEVFARRGEGTPVDPVVVEIEVPNGLWNLRLAPEVGWYPLSGVLFLVFGSLTLALIVTVAQYQLLHRFSR
jgi:sensor domain CHASE-containing protein